MLRGLRNLRPRQFSTSPYDAPKRLATDSMTKLQQTLDRFSYGCESAFLAAPSCWHALRCWRTGMGLQGWGGGGGGGEGGTWAAPTTTSALCCTANLTHTSTHTR